MIRRILAAVLGLALLAIVGDAQPAAEKPKTDPSGDPLPAGALARMGTVRLRHGEAVTYVAFTPNGKGVLTAAGDKSIHLWDRKTGKEIRRFAAAAEPLEAGMRVPPAFARFANGAGSRIALSKDGKVFAAVLPNNSIQFWNVETGKEIDQFPGPERPITSIVFAPDGKSIAARTFGRATFLLDTATGQEIRRIKTKQPKSAVGVPVPASFRGADGLAFSPDGKILVTAEMVIRQNKVAVHLLLTDAKTSTEIADIDTGHAGISSIAFSPDGKMLAFGGGRMITLRHVDSLKKARPVGTSINTNFDVAGLAFAPDGKTLAARGTDRVVHLYEADTGKATHTLGQAVVTVGVNPAQLRAYGLTELRDLAFSHDGKILAIGGTQALRFFTVATGKEQTAAGGHSGTVSAVVLTPDGKIMISRGADDTIRRWEAGTGKQLGQFHEPKGTVAVMFSPDTRTAAVVTMPDGAIHLIDSADGKQLREFKGHPAGVASVAFSPNGKLLASRGARDNTILLYDIASGAELKQITIPADKQANLGGGQPMVRYGIAGQGLAFAPDGQFLAANINVGKSIMVRPGGGAAPAENTEDNLLRIWDVATAKEIRKFPLPATRNVANIAYSPDGRLIAAENDDQSVSLWEIASGKERALLGAPSGGPKTAPIISVRPNVAVPFVAPTFAFSPDGRILATRAPNHAVRVFDVAHAKEIDQFRGHEGTIQALTFTADGKSLASASADTTLLLWDATRLKREPKLAAVELSAKDLESLWADLLADDAGKASQAIVKLAAAGKQATPFLRDQIKPATPPDVKKLSQWLADLDSTNFKKRTQASAELEKLGDLAVPALRKILDTKPSPETRRRVEPILDKLLTGTLNPEQIRVVRAVEALERIGGSDARALLATLAKGAPGALTTRHAQAALAWLAKQ